MPETPAEPYLPTVLTVDDDPYILDLLNRYLSLQQLRVIGTSDPESVIETAAREQPRLIISDIAMPGMNGLRLLQRLKADARTADIPVVLLTSSRSGDDVREALNAGAEAYLMKPIDWDMSWPKIQAILLRS
jgi:DNA-binding response OmpR family regulator